jgi:hypothetical protein
MRLLILVAVLLAGSVQASPTMFTGSIQMDASAWNGDFSRAQGVLPKDAVILAVYRSRSAVTVHFAFDPEAPDVWRRVIMTRGVMPVPVPLDRFIDENRGVYFWDEGQFSAPLGVIARD